MRRIGLAVVLALGFALAPLAAEAQEARSGPLSFENADIGTVIKYVGRLTGITFLFDPEQVKGKITLLSAKSIVPAEALELLKSALALHGYSLLSRAEGIWIVPAVRVAQEAITVKVVPLTYARAGELAYTLSWIAPPGVRIVPYYPTNSLVIAGPSAAVEELIDIVKPSARD
jgi:type II secretory pathway component GspD/PulD (secretin)